MAIIQQMNPIQLMLRTRAEEKLVPISSSQPKGLAPNCAT